MDYFLCLDSFFCGDVGTRTFSYCRREGDRGELGVKGRKGTYGIYTGSDTRLGPKGELGEDGFSGMKGFPGLLGFKGETTPDVSVLTGTVSFLYCNCNS